MKQVFKGLASMVMVKVIFALSLGVVFMPGLLRAERWDRDAETNWLTKKKTVGDVTITATFRNPHDIWDPGYLIFYVILESEKTNLDGIDFKNDFILRDDNDWTFLPKIVNETGSGQRREVVLKFLRSRFKVDYIELVLRKTEGVDETVFRWLSLRSDFH